MFLLTFFIAHICIYKWFFCKKLLGGQNLSEYVHWGPNDNQIKNLENPPATNILFFNVFLIYMYIYKGKTNMINFIYVLQYTPKHMDWNALIRNIFLFLPKKMFNPLYRGSENCVYFDINLKIKHFHIFCHRLA